jgi:hypothetical protein
MGVTDRFDRLSQAYACLLASSGPLEGEVVVELTKPCSYDATSCKHVGLLLH